MLPGEEKTRVGVGCGFKDLKRARDENEKSGGGYEPATESEMGHVDPYWMLMSVVVGAMQIRIQMQSSWMGLVGNCCKLCHVTCESCDSCLVTVLLFSAGGSTSSTEIQF